MWAPADGDLNSNYTAFVDGRCTSMLPGYTVPSEVCGIAFGYVSLHEITSTETIFGTTFTGEVDLWTPTAPGVKTTISLSTTTTSADGTGDDHYFRYYPDWLAVDVVDVLYLVYAPSETGAASNTTATSGSGAATGSSNATGNTSVATTARTGNSYVVMLITMCVAFTWGFVIVML